MENLPGVSQLFTEAFGQASHMVTGHLMVGDWFGFNKGVIDYFTNQAQLGLFYTIFTLCYLSALGSTFWLNDEGVAFYQCYKNFPSKVIFY